MTEDQRPDPEYLLALIKRESDKEKGGKLKIFFGMAAGVGKTFSMLEAAQQAMKEGVDVVIGTIQTHGRKETAALLENIPVIPEKFIRYKDTVFEEMDLEAILTRKPQLVLVDELAHTNIPGSRHPKRWQDVMDILDAGIDVYTTLNVQHLDSLKQTVEEVTGLKVRETVPDIVIERASEIELVDIPPSTLLKRLKEGKVYLGSHPQMAAEHFFKEDRLTALREISLRYAAEKVDHDLQSLVTRTDTTDLYKISNRLLVAVSQSPHSEYLIRAARRIAYSLNAPWIALHIDDGAVLTKEGQERLSKHLSLARDLGAEVVTVTHPHIPTAIKYAIKQHKVTQVIMGRPSEWTPIDIWQGGTLLDHVARENRDVDLIVVRQQLHVQADTKPTKGWGSFFKLRTTMGYYWAVLAMIIVLTLFNLSILPLVGWKTIGFIYLLSILTLSLFAGRGPILLAAFLSAIILNLLFIPSVEAAVGPASENLIFFLIYLFTAIITGTLVTRIKHREEMLETSEEYTQLLYLIEHEIATAPSPSRLFEEISKHLNLMFKGDFTFARCQLTDPSELEAAKPFPLNNKENAVALWTIQNGKAAGWSTDTLPSVETLIIPLKGHEGIIGVMAFRPHSLIPLLPEQKNLLFVISQRLANYTERYIFEQEQQKTTYMKQVENLQQNIMNIVSEQFSEPMKSILHALKNLEDTPPKREIYDALEKLYYVVKNFKDMSHLRTDLLTLQKKQHNLADFIEQCLPDVKTHTFAVDIPSKLPELSFDYDLMKLAVGHIIKNALTYAPEGTKIEIKARTTDDSIVLSIADEGPGIPPELIDKIFEKFYRIPGTGQLGTGLGLALAKTIIDIHGGTIQASNRPEGGADFRITLPIQT